MEKASEACEVFSRMRSVARGNWGLYENTTTTLYKAVFLARMAYASSVWAIGSLKKRVPRNSVLSAQRIPLIGITKAFRTTSTDALAVLAGVLPLDLELLERAKIEMETVAERLGARTTDQPRAKSDNETKARSILLWNQRWVISEKGRWTARWFPTVQDRLRRPWAKPDYYTSQFVTGHGNFGAYFHRFNLRDEASCVNCGYDNDDVAHVLFDCPHFDHEREKLRLTAPTVTAVWPCELEDFTRSEKMYKAFQMYCTSVMIKRAGVGHTGADEGVN